MELQSVESLYRLLASLPGQGPDNGGSGAGEPLRHHRRGHWFNSSIAHRVSGLDNTLQALELLISSMDPDFKRRLELRQMSNEELFKL